MNSFSGIFKGRDWIETQSWSQEDINEIQLAKAAIFTGCRILMKKKNVKRKNLDQVLIAGAFGSYINHESAKLIGLVPDVPTEKIVLHVLDQEVVFLAVHVGLDQPLTVLHRQLNVVA